jgi:hypothetical protein
MRQAAEPGAAFRPPLWLVIQSRIGAPMDVWKSVIKGVSMSPGQTLLIRMPRSASGAACRRVRTCALCRGDAVQMFCAIDDGIAARRGFARLGVVARQCRPETTMMASLFRADKGVAGAWA